MEVTAFCHFVRRRCGGEGLVGAAARGRGHPCAGSGEASGRARGDGEVWLELPTKARVPASRDRTWRGGAVSIDSECPLPLSSSGPGESRPASINYEI